MNQATDNPADTPNAAFVICVEPGPLEYKALCLVLTLRKNGGRWKDLPVFAYSPREGRVVSPWLKEIFARYDITHIEGPINRKWPDYPLANKPLAMRDAEQRLSTDLVIFLDTDILVWAAPDDLELAPTKALGMVIDADKSVGSAGPGDPMDPMWRDLYALAGVEREEYVQTTLSRETVRAWWCSGVIATRRSAGIMSEWMSVFERALDADFFVPRARYLREQMTFSAVAARHFDAVVNLGPRYNYHVQNDDQYVRVHGLPAHKAVLWHYQCYLDKAFAGFKTKLDKLSTPDERIEAAGKLIDRLRVHHRRMIGIDETWVASWRRRLRLGVRVRRLLGLAKETDRFV